jgi:hypothetical protein
LTESEIFNGLSSQCLVERRAPLAAVARAAGVSRMSCYRIIHSRVASLQMRAALSPVLSALCNGTLTFRRAGPGGRIWEGVEHPPPPAEEPKGALWVSLPCNPRAQGLTGN